MSYPQMGGHSITLGKCPTAILTLVRLRFQVYICVSLQLILNLERLATNFAHKAGIDVHPLLMVAQIFLVGKRFLAQVATYRVSLLMDGPMALQSLSTNVGLAALIALELRWSTLEPSPGGTRVQFQFVLAE